MNKIIKNNYIPIVKFRIIDNPYNNTNNFFKYNFYVPLKINILNNDDKINTYSMFPNKESIFDNNFKRRIFKNLEYLFQNYTQNTQTAKLEEGNISIEYTEPFLIKEKCLNLLTFVTDQKQIVDLKNIHYCDIHIKLEQNSNKNYINFPVWKKENEN